MSFYQVPGFIHSFQFTLMQPPNTVDTWNKPVLWMLKNAGHSMRKSTKITTTTKTTTMTTTTTTMTKTTTTTR